MARRARIIICCLVMAAKIVGKTILSKQCITQGNGYEVPLKIEYEE